MLRTVFITVLVTIGIATTGFCSDIIYSLTGHEFMPVQKGNLYMEISSTTANTEDYSIIDGSIIEDTELDVHTMALFGAFDLSDKLSININLPYVNSKKTVGNNSIKGRGIGDISAGVKYQVLTREETVTDLFLHLTTISATGDSPYDNYDKLATGSGGYSLKPKIAIATTIKNSVPFCSIFYQYNLKIDDLSYYQYLTDGESGVYLKEVEPGDDYGISIGFVELIRDNLSLLLSYDYHKSMTSDYNWVGREDYETASMDFSKIVTGMGLKFSSGLALFSTFSIGIGNEAPDYELGISVSY